MGFGGSFLDEESGEFDGLSSPPPPPSMLSLIHNEPPPLKVTLKDWKATLFPEEVQFHAALQELLELSGVKAGRGLEGSVKGDTASQLLKTLMTTCDGHQDDIRNQCSGKNPKLVEREIAQADRLKLERNTWSLLLNLLHTELNDRVAAESGADQAAMGDEMVQLDRSVKAVVGDLYRTSKLFRKRVCVLSWLQSLAYENERVEEATDPEGGEEFVWTETLRRLELGKGPEGIGHMDPDANVQDISDGGVCLALLDPMDEEAEEEILTGVWTLVRSGKLEEAIAYCQRRGHHWRAASLRGAQLFTEEDDPEDETPYLGGGNPRRSLWLETTAALCQSLKKGAQMRKFRPVEHLELAIAACLSGDLNALMSSPLCVSWEEQAWAMFRCLHDRMIDEEIFAHQEKQLKKSKFYPGLDFVTHNESHLKRTQETAKLTEAMIFVNLKSEKASVASRAAAAGCPYRQCQAAAVTGLGALYDYIQETLHPLLCAQNTQDGDSSVVEQGPALRRFGAHLAIYTRAAWAGLSPEALEKADDDKEGVKKVSLVFPEKEAMEIIESYTSYLAKAGQPGRTALYLSFFPVDRCIPVYAQILKEVTKPEERKDCINQALLHFPENIIEILCKVVSEARVAKTEAEIKVDALEWLCFESTHMPLAMEHGLALIRQFVLGGLGEGAATSFIGLQLPKLTEAEMVMKRLKALIAASADCTTADGKKGSCLWEYQQWKKFFHAHHAYAFWSTTLSTAQSQGAAKLPTMAEPQSGDQEHPTAEQILYSRQVEDHIAVLEKQNADVLNNAEEARLALRTVLLCSDGWLKCSEDELNFGSQEHFEQLNQIRAACIPQILFMLHRVLHSTASWALSFQTNEDYSAAEIWYKQSMDLANLVASEEFQLLEIVEGSNLTHLLGLVHDSCMALLKIKGDVC